MFVIVIGEYGEYGMRLGRYLESHWGEPLRIYRYTLPESLLLCDERADWYLLGEEFLSDLGDRLPPAAQSRILIISDEEKEGHFCRYHAPKNLLSILQSQKRMAGLPQRNHAGNIRLTAVYSPVFEENLRYIASVMMEPGDLYLGMEDVGDFISDRGNMGDLCYYIGVREPEIAARLKEIATEENGCWFVDSPNLFYELLELKEEEYRWFFHQLREAGWSHIFAGMGSAAFIPFCSLFDNIILLDSKEKRRQHIFCDYMEQAVTSGMWKFTGEYERKYREEVLGGSVQ